MNTPKEFQPTSAMENVERFLGHIFSQPHRVCLYNTYQFSDYSKYVVEVFDEKDKSSYRENMLSKELNEAFLLGLKIGQ